jgi:hypothetical protein
MITLKELFEFTAKQRKKINPTGAFAVKKAIPIIGPMGIGNHMAVQAVFNVLSEHEDRYDHYYPVIVFYGLHFGSRKTPAHPFGVEMSGGTIQWMERPSYSNTEVMVRCDCYDYYYACWWWNRRLGNVHSGIDMDDDGKGNYIPYQRKTPAPPAPGAAPRANPWQRHQNELGIYPGEGMPLACKHILRMGKYLIDKGMVTQ